MSDRVLGVGIDLCELDRVEGILGRLGDQFLNRAFTTRELSYIGAGPAAGRRCAGIFAAKEAVVKCLGTGFSCGVGWKSVEILPESAVRPVQRWQVVLHEEAERRSEACGKAEWVLDMHYTGSHAVAVAIWSAGAGTPSTQVRQRETSAGSASA